MDAKEFLIQYDNCEKRENRMKSEILWEKDHIEKLKLHSSIMTKKMKEDLSHIEERHLSLKKKLVEVSKQKKKVFDLITSIPGIEGEVLRRRYIDGEIWEEICEGIHYSWVGAFSIHERALRMVQERLDQEDLE